MSSQEPMPRGGKPSCQDRSSGPLTCQILRSPRSGECVAYPAIAKAKCDTMTRWGTETRWGTVTRWGTKTRWGTMTRWGTKTRSGTVTRTRFGVRTEAESASRMRSEPLGSQH